ncbi:MAG: GNAT family N-acetyltransferase [Deltaproteobacteria bacterium]|nr:GNAT family N-acetyltransferase [Deltaproteobacteria bacterium]
MDALGENGVMKNPTIELATHEDIEQIVDLRQHCMPHVPTSKSLVEWQFFKNPLGTANVYVIRSSAGLVSMIATLPRNIRVRGEVRKGRTMVDIMTVPAYRGKGIAHQHGFRCWQDMTDACEIAYILPNQHSEKSFRRAGWTELMRVPLRLIKVASGALKPFHNVYQKVESFDSRATEVWNRCPFPVGVHRDADYLNWRYSKPDSVYSQFMIGDDQGVIVLKLFSDGTNSLAHICELFVADSQPSVVEDALRFCHDFAARSGADTLTCWMSEGHVDESVYTAFGFKLEHPERFIFFKPAIASDKALKEIPWHFSQGDSDVY